MFGMDSMARLHKEIATQKEEIRKNVGIYLR